MLARLTRRPFDSPDYIFELKWDGVRVLAFVEDGRVRLQGRDLQDVTDQFPELDKLPQQVRSDSAVLDGELVCFDRQGRPDLERLQRRLRRQAEGRANRGPRVHFIAFDILYINGRSVMDQPLVNRKNLLHETLSPSRLAQACEFIDADGEAFFKATCDLGLEGIMAKEKAGLYVPGERNVAWRKVKRVRESEFVIGGHAFGGEDGARFGSLLLGLYDDAGRLNYVGSVSDGFSRLEVRRLQSVIQGLHQAECPFVAVPELQKFIYWCRPGAVCRVDYGEFTPEGRLRYPVYQTLRTDKPAVDCRMLDAPGWPQTRPDGTLLG